MNCNSGKHLGYFKIEEEAEEIYNNSLRDYIDSTSIIYKNIFSENTHNKLINIKNQLK